jgi:hypothetical protein
LAPVIVGSVLALFAVSSSWASDDSEQVPAIDRVNGIQVEDKDDIVKRLGRSPDCADAVVLAAMPPTTAPVAFL